MLAAKPIAVYTDNEDMDPTPGIRLLEEHGFEVRYLKTLDPDLILAGAQGASALLVGYAPIPERVISGLPDLQIISLVSMGFDNIDVEAARAHGVWVTNLPGIASEEVATHALSLILATVRQLPFFQRSITEDWIARPANLPFKLSQKTLGIVGLGRIGAKLAGLAAPLFGEIIGYDPYAAGKPELKAQIEALGVRMTTLEEVLAQSDVVSLHLPLTTETQNMMNEETLSLMKRGSYLVNVSRGKLIDTDALLAALDSGAIAGAGLDVLDVEPPPADHPLIVHERTIVTPHVGFLSDFTQAEYIRVQAQNVISLFETDVTDTAPVIDPRVRVSERSH